MQGATNFKQYVHLNQQSREMQAAKKRLLDEIDGTMNAEGKTLHCEDGTNFFVRLPPKPKKATLDIDFVVVGLIAFFAEKGIDIGANDAQEFGRYLEKKRLVDNGAPKKRTKLQTKRPPEAYF